MWGETNLLGEEIPLHALRGQSVCAAKAGVVAEAAVARGLRRLLNLNPAVIDVATPVDILHIRSTPDLAELVRWTEGGKFLLEVLSMARTLEEVRVGSDGAWWIEAVGMPPEAAQGAWEDRTVLSCGLLASVADDRLLSLVHNLMVVKVYCLNSLLLPDSVCQLTCGTE